MNLKRVSKKDLRQNPQNPRDINENEMAALIQSLITFPEMLLVRPIVMGSDGISLGGNQRFMAIEEIREYTPPVKSEILEDQRIIRKRANASDEHMKQFEEAMNYLLYDKDFLVIDVSFLTPEMQDEFIVKDNVSFGNWNWEALDSLWGKEKLAGWGLEVPTWLGSKEDKNSEKEVDEEDMHTEHTCPKCGYEFN